MIHATAKAIECVRRRLLLDRSLHDVRDYIQACDGAVIYGALIDYGTLWPQEAAEALINDRESNYTLPTCQHCRVLLDIALENPIQ